jgi:hypothetical protein
VVVTGGLNPDPAHHGVAAGTGTLDRGQQPAHAQLVERELEGRNHHLSVTVRDERDRRPLAASTGTNAAGLHPGLEP